MEKIRFLYALVFVSIIVVFPVSRSIASKISADDTLIRSNLKKVHLGLELLLADTNVQTVTETELTNYVERCGLKSLDYASSKKKERIEKSISLVLLICTAIMIFRVVVYRRIKCLFLGPQNAGRSRDNFKQLRNHLTFLAVVFLGILSYLSVQSPDADYRYIHDYDYYNLGVSGEHPQRIIAVEKFDLRPQDKKIVLIANGSIEKVGIDEIKELLKIKGL